MDENIPLQTRRSLSATSTPPYESRPSSLREAEAEPTSTSITDVDDRERDPDGFEPYDLPPPDGSQSPKPPSYSELPPQVLALPLRRSGWALVIAICYILPACFSWIVLCLLRTRPLSIGTYEYTGKQFYNDDHYYRNTWAANERWYDAARVFQTLVGVFTIPTASGICGYASVVYAQRNRLSLRKLLALADRGFANPTQLFSGLKIKSATASRFFVLAVLVHLIGVLIWPLQMGLISTKLIKVPSDEAADALSDDYAFPVIDLNDLSAGNYQHGTTRIAPMASLGMQQISSDGFEPHLWQRGPLKYTTLGQKSDLADENDYFYSQLPVGYHTGVVRQNAPRINSTADVSCVDEFPPDCDDRNALTVTYHHGLNDPDSNFWAVQLCIPPGSTTSPWSATRDRQDFQETLYLNVSTSITRYRYEKKCVARVDLKTTAGLFELPNYMNGGKPGPLMEKAPESPTVEKRQYSTAQDFAQNISQSIAQDPAYHNPHSQILNVILAGPLYTAAVALFADYHGFLPQCFAASQYDWNVDPDSITQSPGPLCAAQPPLEEIIAGVRWITKRAKRYGHEWPTDAHSTLQSWLGDFVAIDDTDYLELIGNAWEAASFKSVEATFHQYSQESYMSYAPRREPGMDTHIPAFSQASMIAISVLLGLFLLSLVGLAIYAHTPAWTTTLDAFAILRIGAQIPDHAPLRLCYEPENYRALDHLPGWMGETDSALGEDAPGRLELGSEAPLVKARKYEAYTQRVPRR